MMMILMTQMTMMMMDLGLVPEVGFDKNQCPCHNYHDLDLPDVVGFTKPRSDTLP